MKGWKNLIFTEILLKNLLWTHRKQEILPKTFHRTSTKDEKAFSATNFLPSDVLLETQNLVLTTLPKKFANGRKSLHWKSEKDKISCKLIKCFCISEKQSSGHVVCSFDSPAQNLWVKVCFQLPKNRNRWRKSFFLINSFKKLFPPGTESQVLTTFPLFLCHKFKFFLLINSSW